MTEETIKNIEKSISILQEKVLLIEKSMDIDIKVTNIMREEMELHMNAINNHQLKIKNITGIVNLLNEKTDLLDKLLRPALGLENKEEDK